MPVTAITLVEAHGPEQVAVIRDLFQEYGASLGFSLCFQSFDEELARLPGEYAPPSGRLLLASVDGAPAGCAALHRLDDRIAEMKRLYVRPAYRGQKLGLALTQRILQEARAIGYTHVRLDTVAGVMDDAIRVYRRLGFREIAPYRENPIAGALYMELEL